MDFCSICNNRKYIQEANIFKPCECLKKSKYLYKLRQSGLNEEYDDITYESLEKEWKKNQNKINNLIRFKEYAKRIIDKKTKHYNRPLVITGRDGSGKMLMVSCFLKDCIKNGKSVFLTNLLDMVDQNFNEDQSAKKDFFNRIYHCDILCIQLGIERKNSMNNELLSTVCNIRKNKKKYIIFVSRPPQEKFVSMHGEIGKYIDERERIDL